MGPFTAVREMLKTKVRWKIVVTGVCVGEGYLPLLSRKTGERKEEAKKRYLKDHRMSDLFPPTSHNCLKFHCFPIVYSDF